MLLSAGKFVARGETGGVAAKYLEMSRATLTRTPIDDTKPRIVDVQILDKSGVQISSVEAGEYAQICFTIDTKGRERLIFGSTVFNAEDEGILSAVTSDSFEFIPSDALTLRLDLPTEILHAGRYRIEGALTDDRSPVEKNDCDCQFNIHRGRPFDVAGEKPLGLIRFPKGWDFN